MGEVERALRTIHERAEKKRQRVERLKTAPYRFWAFRSDQEFASRFYQTRAAALKDIRRLQKKGYKIEHFYNEWTGKKLTIPGDRS